jgi:hypothetical protein
MGCGRRAAILYGGTVFACRHCYHLNYDSQREQPAGRARRRAQAIRMRLGTSGVITEPFPAKPKKMHVKTYERLHLQAREAEDHYWGDHWGGKIQFYRRFEQSMLQHGRGLSTWERSQVAPVATRRKARSLPSISEQCMKFEFTSLRHAVSTAERFCCICAEMCEKGALFGIMPEAPPLQGESFRECSRSQAWLPLEAEVE